MHAVIKIILWPTIHVHSGRWLQRQRSFNSSTHRQQRVGGKHAKAATRTLRCGAQRGRDTNDDGYDGENFAASAGLRSEQAGSNISSVHCHCHCRLGRLELQAPALGGPASASGGGALAIRQRCCLHTRCHHLAPPGVVERSLVAVAVALLLTHRRWGMLSTQLARVSSCNTP